jgi:uncharacterized membrane protein YagU involved in acid resistance
MAISIVAPQPAHPFRTIITAGLVAGALDALDAALVITALNNVSAVRVFQFIASGLLGVQSFRGGTATAILGVLLHFTIAIGAAATFYFASLRLPFLLRKPLLWGPIYGIAVFLFMHYIVVPLSATPKQASTSAADYVNLVFSHIFFIGIPIALITSRSVHKVTAE